MEKEKFSKEEIETAQFLYDKWGSSKYTSPTFKGFLNSLLKTETKFIDVRIEYESDASNSSLPLTANNLETHFDCATELKGVKVTELPEVFTREDMIEFANIDHIRYCDIEPNLEKFISERNQNE